jgi:hypothetical protein
MMTTKPESKKNHRGILTLNIAILLVVVFTIVLSIIEVLIAMRVSPGQIPEVKYISTAINYLLVSLPLLGLADLVLSLIVRSSGEVRKRLTTSGIIIGSLAFSTAILWAWLLLVVSNQLS